MQLRLQKTADRAVYDKMLYIFSKIIIGYRMYPNVSVWTMRLVWKWSRPGDNGPSPSVIQNEAWRKSARDKEADGRSRLTNAPNQRAKLTIS